MSFFRDKLFCKTRYQENLPTKYLNFLIVDILETFINETVHFGTFIDICVPPFDQFCSETEVLDGGLSVINWI